MWSFANSHQLASSALSHDSYQLVSKSERMLPSRREPRYVTQRKVSSALLSIDQLIDARDWLERVCHPSQIKSMKKFALLDSERCGIFRI